MFQKEKKASIANKDYNETWELRKEGIDYDSARSIVNSDEKIKMRARSRNSSSETCDLRSRGIVYNDST